jgi:acyl transferase domain-containing protein
MAASKRKMSSHESIAVVGMSYVFPGGVSSDDVFWDMLMQKRNATTDFPESRMNIDAFHSTNPERQNTITTRKANFLSKDIWEFDANFFGVSRHEAASMDPQHRILLETTYHALENGKCRHRYTLYSFITDRCSGYFTRRCGRVKNLCPRWMLHYRLLLIFMA